MKPHSEAFKRRRNFLLVFPLLVLPFLTLAFWALGGGQGPAALSPREGNALNVQLPAPRLPQEGESSKLSLYRQAGRSRSPQQDSGGKNFLHQLGLSPGEPGATASAFAPGLPGVGFPAPGIGDTPQEANEEKIQERLAQLSQLVTQHQAGPAAKPPAQQTGTPPVESRFSLDVAKLETMMHRMGGGGAAEDSEMQRLEGMLDRILDIQHPERVQERRQEASPQNQGQAFSMQAAPRGPAVGFLHQPSPGASRSHFPDAPGPAQNAFYSLTSQSPAPEAQQNAIEAAVHETQTLLSGAPVKLRLLRDATLAGSRLPAGSLLYGLCQLRGERLAISVTSVRSGSTLLPVSLAAFDLDGIEGLYIPGAPVREAARQGAGGAISQSLQLPSLTPSLGSQALGAGLDAARGLLSRQARQVKVTLPAGHRLLLLDRQAPH